MVLTDSRPANIYSGPDQVSIYNEGFIQLVSAQHPRMMATRKTVDIDDIALSVLRNGLLEECYFVGQFIPIAGDSGNIEGVYNTSFESTSSVLHARQRRAVERIASIPRDALKCNPRDIPMAMLYSYDKIESLGRNNLHLCGTVGIPDGHSCAPKRAHLTGTDIGIIPYLREALDSGAPVLIACDQTDVASGITMFEGIDWVGHGLPLPRVLVLALRSGKRRLGFYVQGINPRRPYDQSVEMAIVDHARQNEARWAASISKEEARQREGTLELIDEGDRERAFADFQKLSEGQPTLSNELRLIRRWSPPAEELHDGEDPSNISAWILTTSIALYEDGKMKFLLGCVMDISRQKFAESVQARNAAAATQARRRQEEFIDTTSHEMRNPLSAITQLADGIARSLDESPDMQHNELNYKAIALDNVASAKILLACGGHQKRVQARFSTMHLNDRRSDAQDVPFRIRESAEELNVHESDPLLAPQTTVTR
ncbi:hypothetical protein LTR78_004101 [Recurvomyces mirabilis]|uniref:PAC domain-containing protein n=1 Tax=Recurvomyces mirabilis TaxID=574656 RepID=A0AAE0WQF2_9PEZI|nr:hypothetical protein LTR78_004101 [Recurvomyces mirabilis]KAK5153726.1 hypothetical protein LTS14_007420 [Recurvomyces mirabilis]